MRIRILWQAAAVLATLAFQARVMAQPPDRRGPPPDRRGPGGGLERVLDDLKLSPTKRDAAGAAVRAYQDNGRRLAELAGADLLLKLKEILSEDEFKQVKVATERFRNGPPGLDTRNLTVDDLVERILSFDKNKDGLITEEELPERMRDLIAKGDTNKDGALDKEEIRKLAAAMVRDGSVRGPGPGPGGRGGQGGQGGGIPPHEIERVIADLKLSEKKKEQAAAAVKASHDNIRKLTDLARADLLVRMDDLLAAEELTKFKAALDRQPGFGERPPFPPPGRPRPDRP